MIIARLRGSGMVKKLIASILFLIILTSLVSGCKSDNYEMETTVFSDMIFSVSLNGKNAVKAGREMEQIVGQIDKAISLSKNDSELTRLNNASEGERVEISKTVYELIVLSKDLYKKTKGAFNVAVSKISELWNVDINGITKYCYGEQTPPPFPTQQELENQKATTNLDTVLVEEINEKYYVTRTDKNVKLDFGGIAKGYICDRLKNIAKDYGITSGMISLSGNLMFLGINQKKQSEWSVGITNPRRTTLTQPQHIMAFYTSECSVVTSGDYERYYEKDGVRINHVIDGRTLMPVGVERISNDSYKNSDSYVVSCTIVGDSSAYADALATAVMVLGVDEGQKMIAELGYKGVIFTSDKKYSMVGEIKLIESETHYKTYTKL